MQQLSQTRKAIYQRNRQQRRRAANLCANCPNQTSATIRCAECSKKRSAYDKEYIQRRLAAGLCPYCSNQRVGGLTRCKDHIKKHGAVYYKRKDRDLAEHGVYHYTAHRREVRDEVIKHYGATCAVCLEHRLPFLTIDHITNNGATHNKQTSGVSGKQLAIWLKNIISRLVIRFYVGIITG